MGVPRTTFTDRLKYQYRVIGLVEDDMEKHTETVNETQRSSVYEQLLPKNEWPILQLLRRWEKHMGFQTPLIWSNVIFITLVHFVTILWFLRNLLALQFPMWQTIFFEFAVYIAAGWGVTGGVHRYWSHRAYKQKRYLQMWTLICYSAAGQNTVLEWVRDHRVHHKYSETSADPHDSNRGFFFSHVGWLMMKKRPEVAIHGKRVDMSDIVEDPLIQFHQKHFTTMKIFFCFYLPTCSPVIFWGESWSDSILATMVRYLILLNATWSVNSVAHIWGHKPYDRYINPSENWGVSFFTSGEGWHNYHHTFPWDYKAAELGGHLFNFTTYLIEKAASVGWAYDLKTASPTLINAISHKKGERQF